MNGGNKVNPFFHLKVSPKSPLPVYEQIKLSVKLAVVSGRLRNGDKLMPLRELAIKLQVNPNTILKVYGQLEKEGYIVSRLRSGYFVQFDKEELGAEKRLLLRDLTSEYLSQASRLGCSSGEIFREICKVLGPEKTARYLRGAMNDIG